MKIFVIRISYNIEIYNNKKDFYLVQLEDKQFDVLSHKYLVDKDEEHKLDFKFLLKFKNDYLFAKIKKIGINNFKKVFICDKDKLY